MEVKNIISGHNRIVYVQKVRDGRFYVNASHDDGSSSGFRAAFKTLWQAESCAVSVAKQRVMPTTPAGHFINHRGAIESVVSL